MTDEKTQYRAGLVCAVLAHIMWGLFPLFWRLLSSLDPWAVVSYRVIFAWSILMCCMPWIMGRNAQQRQHLQKKLHSLKTWRVHALAAALIFTNWLVFIWAVGQNRILEASLGYFINPLLNVVLGVLVIRETLNALQWTAVAVAGLGVASMASASAGLPWISLLLALTFSVYGLIKKSASLPPVLGLTVEVTTLLGPALLLLLLLAPTQTADLKDAWMWCLLGLGGLITIMPLSLFAFAAKNVPLSTLGILQYVGPTLQFAIGTFLLTEPFGTARLLGFVCVWLALVMYVLGTRSSRD